MNMNKLLITFFTVLFCLTSSLVYSEEFKMKCNTKNILQKNVTFLKFHDSFFKSKVTERISGNWKNISDNPLFLSYQIGDFSSTFVIKRQGKSFVTFLRVILDFESKQILWKRCENSNCGIILSQGIRNCE